MASAPGSEDQMSEQRAQRLASVAATLGGSRGIAYEAWRRIASSRHRIFRRPPIAGGSSGRLREDIRRRLADGTLPRTSGHAWIGAARGDRRCTCCFEVIAPPNPEYAVRDRVEQYAHAMCFAVWVEESVARDAANGGRAPRDVGAPRPWPSEVTPGSRGAQMRRGRPR